MIPIVRGRRVAALALLALLLAVLPLAAACSGDDGDAKKTPPPAPTYLGVKIEPAPQMPDAVLTSTSGQPFDLRKDSKAPLTLVYLGYTHCPDVCPTHMYDVSRALRALPQETQDKVQLLFVTTDPARDTPQALREWLDHFDKRFEGLVGTDEQVAAIQAQLGMPPSKKTDLGNGNYAVSHAAYVLAYTQDGFAHLVYPSGMTQEEWKHDIPLLVKEGYQE